MAWIFFETVQKHIQCPCSLYSQTALAELLFNLEKEEKMFCQITGLNGGQSPLYNLWGGMRGHGIQKKNEVDLSSFMADTAQLL